MTAVAIITGSPNNHSRLNGLLDFAEKYLDERNIPFEVINVHSLPAKDLITANFDSEEIQHANQIVEKAGGIIMLTPVYKASFSGILKTYLDLLPQKALENKVVLPLVIGGSFGHLLTIQYALNPVLNELGASHILNGVYTIDQQIQRIGKDQFYVQEEPKQRLRKALDGLMIGLNGPLKLR
ncbi:NADPH-dependent FMN reductase [Neobacillus sp. Marseille-QA0830]